MFPHHIAETDPAWETIDTYLDNFRDYPGKSKQGYVYVVEIEGARRRLKIGCTTGPRRRITGLRDEARNIGDRLVRAWVSPLHLGFRATEKRSLGQARDVSPSFTKTSEYFPLLSFDDAQVIAAYHAETAIRSEPLAAKRAERERAQARLDFDKRMAARHDSHRTPDETHPNEKASVALPLAAGDYIPMPAQLRGRLYPHSNTKGPSRRRPLALL